STGRMELEDCPPEALGAALARLGATELVAPEEAGPPLAPPASGRGTADTPLPLAGGVGGGSAIPRPRADFSSDAGEARLKSVHGVATLDGFGQFTRPMLAAAGGLLAYLDHVGRGTLPLLLPPVVRAAGATLAMDEATRASLEILEAQGGSGGGGRAGSLLASVDRCVTGAGARLLAEDLAAPLARAPDIEARLNLVQWLHDDPLLRADLRDALRSLPDIGRALGRVVAGRGSPRDLGQVRDGLSEARRIHDLLAGREDRPALLEALLPDLAGHGALTDHLSRALVPSPPTERAQGGFIAEGYFAATLERARRLHSRSLRVLARRATPGLGQCPPRHRRARSALPRRDGRGRAQDPPQRRARLLRRGSEPPRRCAHGARQRLHPPPDHGRRGPLQFAAAPRGSEPHRRRRRPRAGGGRSALRGARRRSPRCARADRRHRGRARPHRRRRRPGGARGRRRLDAAGHRRCALPRGRIRPPPGGRGRARAHRRALRRQRLPARPRQPAVARRRPEHGRQVHLPAPERAHRAARAGRRL